MNKLTMWLVLAPAALAMGCAGTDTSDDEHASSLGETTLELAEVPPDVQCLEIQVDGTRSVTERRTVSPGQAVHEKLTGLPVGQVTFSGNAYPVACPAGGGALPSDTATWVAAPKSVQLKPGKNDGVELAFKKAAQTDVTATFDDDNACGPVDVAYTPLAAEYMVAMSDEPVAQTFTPAANMSVDSVVLPLFQCKSNGLVNARLTLMATNGSGEPNRSAAIAVATAAGANMADACTGGDHFAPVTFAFSGVQLVAGTRYALFLEATDNLSGGLYWRRSSTPQDPSDPYAGGTLYESDFAGGLMPNTNLDLAFQVTGDDCP